MILHFRAPIISMSEPIPEPFTKSPDAKIFFMESIKGFSEGARSLRITELLVECT